MQVNWKEMEELCGLRGISGQEDAVRDYILERVRDHCESFRVDSLGNLLVHKKGRERPGKKVLFSAHMDEVGFVVTHIGEDGMLCFAPVGGISPGVIPGRPVEVGPRGIPGVIGTRPVHLLTAEEREEYPRAEEMRIDIGARNREEAAELAAPGDMVTFVGPWRELGAGAVMAKAIDDRAGCAFLLDMIRGELHWDCDFAFVVQEETGCTGSRAAAFSLRPDIAVVVESTTAGDLPTAPQGRQVCRVGGGPVVSFMDRGTIYPRDLYERITSLAQGGDIPWQTKEGVFGGNDARSYASSAAGAKTAAVSLPVRYLHSPYTLASRKDAEDTRELLDLLARELPWG